MKILILWYIKTIFNINSFNIKLYLISNIIIYIMNFQFFENININNISKNTIKSYFSRIINLIKKLNIDNFDLLDFINKKDEIINFIYKNNENILVRITIISAILYLLNYFELNKNYISEDKLNNARIFYKNKISLLRDTNKINLLNNDNNKDVKTAENWITYSELTDIFNKYYDKYINIINDKKPVKINDYYNIQNMVIFSFYILLEPVRSQEIATLKYKNFDKKTDNYIDIKNKLLIFNDYKTKKTYKTIEIDLSNNDKLINLIKSFILFKQKNKFDIDYLFNSNDNTAIDSSQLHKRLNRIIGLKISSSMIRKIYLSENYKDVFNDINKSAKNMMNSMNVINTHYIKK